jgi:hypothetical protein
LSYRLCTFLTVLHPCTFILLISSLILSSCLLSQPSCVDSLYICDCVASLVFYNSPSQTIVVVLLLHSTYVLFFPARFSEECSLEGRFLEYYSFCFSFSKRKEKKRKGVPTLEARSVSLRPPCCVLRGWIAQVHLLIPDVLLEKSLGLGYLSRDIQLPDPLARALWEFSDPFILLTKHTHTPFPKL